MAQHDEYEEAPDSRGGCRHCDQSDYDKVRCSHCGDTRCGGCLTEAEFEMESCPQCMWFAVSKVKDERDKLRRELHEFRDAVKRIAAINPQHDQDAGDTRYAKAMGRCQSIARTALQEVA